MIEFTTSIFLVNIHSLLVDFNCKRFTLVWTSISAHFPADYTQKQCKVGPAAAVQPQFRPGFLAEILTIWSADMIFSLVQELWTCCRTCCDWPSCGLLAKSVWNIFWFLGVFFNELGLQRLFFFSLGLFGFWFFVFGWVFFFFFTLGRASFPLFAGFLGKTICP